MIYLYSVYNNVEHVSLQATKGIGPYQKVREINQGSAAVARSGIVILFVLPSMLVGTYWEQQQVTKYDKNKNTRGIAIKPLCVVFCVHGRM